ncbi:MAG TPA: hypothetical protein VHE81_20690 [Lacipirellulaceae bacterium]|nr:hypothetical protein [Lacipirellulaceae bacterium]
MLTLYFCWGDRAPVVRCWSICPRIGDTLSLPEFGGNAHEFIVSKVVWEGFEEPRITIHLREPVSTCSEAEFRMGEHVESSCN